MKINGYKETISTESLMDAFAELLARSYRSRAVSSDLLESTMMDLARKNWMDGVQFRIEVSQRRIALLERPTKDKEGLDSIAALLDKNEWNADVFEAVAAAVRETGRTVGDICVDCGQPIGEAESMARKVEGKPGVSHLEPCPKPKEGNRG